jgi:hypothetical protein
LFATSIIGGPSIIRACRAQRIKISERFFVDPELTTGHSANNAPGWLRLSGDSEKSAISKVRKTIQTIFRLQIVALEIEVGFIAAASIN